MPDVRRSRPRQGRVQALRPGDADPARGPAHHLPRAAGIAQQHRQARPGLAGEG